MTPMYLSDDVSLRLSKLPIGRLVQRISDAALYMLLGTLMFDLGLLGVDMRYFAAVLCLVFLVILGTIHLATLNDICHLSAHS